MILDVFLNLVSFRLGDIHFDDNRKWTANARHGHNLRIVAVHEIGHALGLGHSKEKKSVMYLMYQGFKDKIKLHASDIASIQKLYGEKDFRAPKNQRRLRGKQLANSRSSRFAEMTSDPARVSADLCTNSSIDAISTLADGYVYIFKGSFYYKMKMGEEIDNMKYPKLINETFRGLPSNLDTVLTISNGKTYFFKGKWYWRSTGTKMDNNYPKKIQTNFLGIPRNLDGSFVWSWNDRVYFFKKNRYWRYDFNQSTQRSYRKPSKRKFKSRRQRRLERFRNMIPGYPKRISKNWPGIPDDMDDAFKAPNGRTYFFKNGQYWQFHDPDSDVEAASYPRSSRDWWFGCSDFKIDSRKVRHVRKRKRYNYL